MAPASEVLTSASSESLFLERLVEITLVSDASSFESVNTSLSSSTYLVVACAGEEDAMICSNSPEPLEPSSSFKLCASPSLSSMLMVEIGTSVVTNLDERFDERLVNCPFSS